LPEEDKQRFIKAEWNRKKGNVSYDVDVQLLAEDRKGLLSDISRVCEDMDVRIVGLNAKSGKDNIASITMTLSLTDTGQLEKVLRKFRTVSGVMDAYRANL
jgi:GTP pyrophosphokinase